jgi:hypothetical protein
MKHFVVFFCVEFFHACARPTLSTYFLCRASPISFVCSIIDSRRRRIMMMMCDDTRANVPLKRNVIHPGLIHSAATSVVFLRFSSYLHFPGVCNADRVNKIKSRVAAGRKLKRHERPEHFRRARTVALEPAMDGQFGDIRPVRLSYSQRSRLLASTLPIFLAKENSCVPVKSSYNYSQSIQYLLRAALPPSRFFGFA